MYITTAPTKTVNFHEFLTHAGPCFTLSFEDRNASVHVSFDEKLALETIAALHEGLKRANTLEQKERDSAIERETERIWNDPDLLQEVSCDTEFDPDTEFFGILNDVLWNRNPGDAENLLKIGKILNELRDWLEPLVVARAANAWEFHDDGC